jgi:hypothetical protein
MAAVEVEVLGKRKVRLVGGEGDAVEIAVPGAMQARAEEIVRLSRRLGGRGGGFSSPREVLAPALVYGLAHMQERYRQAAVREGGKAAGC